MSVSWEQILDWMLVTLQPLKLQAPPATTPTGAYLRVLDRYLGEFDADDALAASGLSGRSPALYVDFAGEKVITAHVGRGSDKVKGSFLAICATEEHRTRQSRDALFKVMRDARQLLVHTHPSLEITRFKYEGLLTLAERPQVFAYAVQFSTLYQVDYRVEPSDVVDHFSLSGTVREGGTTLGKFKVNP